MLTMPFINGVINTMKDINIEINVFDSAGKATCEAGAVNQTYVVDDFNVSSEPNYHVTSAVIFDGMASLYTGSNYQCIPDGDFYCQLKTTSCGIVNIISFGHLNAASKY